MTFGHCLLLLAWPTLSLKTFQASYKSWLCNRFGLEDGWDAPGSQYVSRAFSFVSLPSWSKMLLAFVFCKWLLGGVYLHSGICVTDQLIINLLRFRELRPFKWAHCFLMLNPAKTAWNELEHWPRKEKLHSPLLIPWAISSPLLSCNVCLMQNFHIKPNKIKPKMQNSSSLPFRY